MCGITGFWRFGEGHGPALEADVRRMADALVHRGPDSAGVWTDPAAGLAFGHRRLAIVDLTPAGHQPMVSASGRFVIIYNGELYNTDELRKMFIPDVSLRGHSDTEVILEAAARHGIDRILPQMNGIFAIALWDRETRTLVLARDALGVKPLVWGFMNGTLLFGSEIFALRAAPEWRGAISTESIAGFLQFGYVPSPATLYQNIHKLAPGTFLEITEDRVLMHGTHWDAYAVARHGMAHRYAGSEAAMLDDLDALIRDAVDRQMVSDVPLGAFLSGGIDSSMVAAAMQAKSGSRKVKTFAIGFHEAAFNEAHYAKDVATALGTDHAELYLHDSQLRDLIPQIPSWYDEPFADSSQLPTYLVSQLARQHVTVALSGDGGDELFAGYGRYARALEAEGFAAPFPAPLRRFAAGAIRALHPERWTALPAWTRLKHRGHAALQLAKLLEQGFNLDIYFGMVGQWRHTSAIMADGGDRALPEIWTSPRLKAIAEPLEQMQYLDLLTYLPDDILIKADRASMAVSLELRVPLLDPRLIAFAWSLPPAWKLRGKDNKWALRQVLYRYVPEALVNRPKMGFGVPLGSWLRGPLRDWAEDLLDEKKMQAEGVLNPTLIRERWAQHTSGQIDWGFPLWTILMLQQWLRAQQTNAQESTPEKQRIRA